MILYLNLGEILLKYFGKCLNKTVVYYLYMHPPFCHILNNLSEYSGDKNTPRPQFKQKIIEWCGFQMSFKYHTSIQNDQNGIQNAVQFSVVGQKWIKTGQLKPGQRKVTVCLAFHQSPLTSFHCLLCPFRTVEYNSGKKNSRTLKIDFITLAQCSFVPYTYNEGARPSIDELELPLSDIYFNHSNYSFELRK